MSILCRVGYHLFEFIGFCQFGRGRLEKCSREGCKKSRRIKISIEELQDQLDDEVKEVKDRKESWFVKIEYLDKRRELVCRACKFVVDLWWGHVAPTECPTCKFQGGPNERQVRNS